MRRPDSQNVVRNLALFRRWAGREVGLRWIPTFTRRVPKAEIYVVGGAVRDALLGRRDRKDLDLVVRNVPITRLERELRRLGQVDLVGRVFGVLKFVPKEEKGRKRGGKGEEKRMRAIDIALPRTEFAFGSGGYRDVDVRARACMRIEEDLGRRDFTINAMAWDLRAGRLVDPFGGMRDLSRQIIRAVGDPAMRFREDYSRMLRALRFAVQLGFTIEPKTWRAIKAAIRHLNDQCAGVWVVPRETIAKELLKAFVANPVRALDLLDDAGAIKVLASELLAMKGCPQPEEYHTEGDVWTHTRLALGVLQSRQFAKEFPEGWGALTAIGLLLHDIGKPSTIRTPERDGVDRIRFDGHDITGAEMARGVANRLALSSYKEARIDVDADRLAFLVKRHLFTVGGEISEMRPTTFEKIFFNPNVPGRELLRVIYCDAMATLGPKGRPDMRDYRALRRRLEELKKLSKTKKALPPSILNGDDVMRLLRIKPGPVVGEVLRALREAQLSGKVRTRAQAQGFVRKWKKGEE